jgi:type 1 glutamine amidotransferase
VRLAVVAVLGAAAAMAAACGDDGGGAGAGAAQPDRFRVLVFTNTTGFRHESIPAGVDAIRRLGREHGFAVEHTEDPRRFTPARLARQDAVVFLSTTGDPLAGAGPRRALRRYIRRGGGFLGIHAAADAFYRRPWLARLVGATFRRHGPGAPAATVVVEDRTSAATRGLPRRWRREDEWYAFRANPRPRVHVLLTLDERTYDPGDAAMGADHPLAWCHRHAGGRSVYTAMGHTTASFSEPRFLRHLLGALEMAASEAPFACAPE